MSYERSDDRERHSDSEENEEREYRETDEEQESPEDKADEAAKDLEREEDAEHSADEASRELDETESESSDAKDLADEASRELDSMENEGNAERSMEDDLGHDLDEVRDDLHDRFVNDMDRQLEEPSQKETETSEQDSDTGSSSDMTESSESYEDAGNGMAYALESKGGSGEAETQTETETEQETADEAKGSNQDVSESESSGEEPEATTDAFDDELTNRVTRQEHTESEEAEEKSAEGTPNHKSSETESDFSKPETSANEAADAQSETESDQVNSLDTKSEYSERFKDEGEQSMETSAESEVNETDSYQSEVEDVSEPIEDSDVEQTHEAEPQEVSDEVQRIVESAESELEEAREVDEGSENEVAETEVSEEEDVLEDLEDFVRRVEDMLDENVDMDDDYDYVQDPLTGEMQRVPKILAEFESEKQRYRRKLRNLFAKLSDEERTLFKGIVRERADTEEERSAEAVERQWSRVVERARQNQNEIEELDDLEKEIHRLYFDVGLSMSETGKKLGFKSARPVQRVFKKQGWTARPSGPQRKSLDYEEMYRLYFEEGCTLKEIAQRFGMDRHTIGKIFREQAWITRRTAAIQRSRILSSKTRQKSHSKKVIDTTEVYRLYFEEGLTMLEVAKMVGFKSTKPIQSVFRKQGWTTRRKDAIRKRESISNQVANKRGKSKSKKSEKILKRSIDSAEVYKLYFVDGLTMMDISKKLGFKSAYPVSQLFKEMGWKRFSGREYRKTVDVDDVYRLYYIEGMTKEKVAQNLGIPESLMRKVFKEMGWKSRIQSFATAEDRAVAKREGAKKTSQRIKFLREVKFGTKCRLCGETRMLAIHNKVGVEHNRNLLWKIKSLHSVDPDEWAALCVPCHRGVHWMMDSLMYGWQELESLALRKQHSITNTLEPLELPSDDTPSSSKYLKLKRKFEGDSAELRDAFFGDVCNFCGATSNERKIPIHRKDGRPHSDRLTKSEKHFRTLNPDEWVSLCSKHHRHVHWAMDTLNLKWDDLKSANNEENWPEEK